MDLARVEVDAVNKTAVVGGGATIGQLDVATQKYILAIPTGTISSIGMGGLTMEGGSGYLSRKFGLTLDSLISAVIVTSFKFRLLEVGPELLSFQAYLGERFPNFLPLRGHTSGAEF